MSAPDGQPAELLRELLDHFDQFRESTVETLKVLYRKQKLVEEHAKEIDATINLHAILLWIMLVVCIIGLLSLLALLLT